MEVSNGEGLNALTTVSSDTISSWDDDKKRDFCKLFASRALDSRIILTLTAREVFDADQRRYFVPSASTFQERVFKNHHTPSRPHGDHQGREYQELQRIASERAKAIVKDLPIARRAVEVIDAETANKMQRVEQINKSLKPLQNQFEEFEQEIRLSDVPQDWTIARFRQFVEAEVKKRKDLASKITKLTREGHELERQIAKALYKGLPGLKEAVVNVVQAHLERSDHLATIARRVEEKVVFGDSEAATTLLGSFEKDEVTVSAEVRAELQGAVAALGIGKKTKKKRTVKKKRLSS